MTLDAQQTLDYADSAQKQVASLTLCLEQKVDLVVPTSGVVALPANVISVAALYNGASRLEPLNGDALLGFLTGAGSAWVGDSSFVILGRDLHVLPLPSVALTLTMIARVRAASLSSGDQLTLGGELDQVTKRLVGGMLLLDSGEPEVALEQLTLSFQEAGRLRVAQTRRSGPPTRIRTPRWDRI